MKNLLLSSFFMNNIPRLDYDANTYESAANYIKNRTIQMLKFGVVLNAIEQHKWALIALFTYQGRPFQSIYILKEARGQGRYSELINIHKCPILTDTSCDIARYLEDKCYEYECLDIEEHEEYKMIQNYYWDRQAERSKVYLMNHIDEWLAILKDIGASMVAQKAYCLHPLLQSDKDLIENIANDFSSIEDQIIITTMEYRNVANAYLSKREIVTLDDIVLSPLKDVNDMLIADKIQNRKDFELYHQSHPRASVLSQYFKNWLEKLWINEEMYQMYKQKLSMQL
jgi:hypothetical protein